MTEHQLSTRDLAARSNVDSPDSSEAQEPVTGERTITTQDSELNGSSSAQAPAERSPGADASDDGNRDADFRAGGDSSPDSPSGVQDRQPLLPGDQGDRFTSRWRDIQTSFVDQPREAVAEADALVADLMQRLAAGFAQERQQLEEQWDSGDDVSTEDLRVALTRYRSFFDRLLSA